MSLIDLYKQLNQELKKIKFSDPCFYVYNPLDYCFDSFQLYLNMINSNEKLNVFFGINPGPYGMSQTGIPFGDKVTVKEYLQIDDIKIDQKNKPKEHPKKKILGLDTNIVEVSGKRIWGLIKKLYPNKEDFFKQNIILNCYPLCFLDKDGKNITPKKLVKKEREQLYFVCDLFLERVLKLLRIKNLIAIGNEAHDAIKKYKTDNSEFNLLKITHPSPLNPKAVNWIEDYQDFFKEINQAWY